MNWEIWIGTATMIFFFMTGLWVVSSGQQESLAEQKLFCIETLVESHLIAHYPDDPQSRRFYINIPVRAYNNCHNVTVLNGIESGMERTR